MDVVERSIASAKNCSQEESNGDWDVFTSMEGERREAGDENCVLHEEEHV